MKEKSPGWTMLFQAFRSSLRAPYEDRNRLVRAIYISYTLVTPATSGTIGSLLHLSNPRHLRHHWRAVTP
eukprot:3371648-Pyramimonas_sp.AAC.1